LPGRDWLGGEGRLSGLRKGWKAWLTQGPVWQGGRVWPGIQPRAGTSGATH